VSDVPYAPAVYTPRGADCGPLGLPAEAPNTFRTQLNSFSVRHVSEGAGHLSRYMFSVIGRSRFLTETS